MFPGPSRQTPREPDLGNPYRVDLGTAMFGMGTEGHEILAGNKQQRWTSRFTTNKHNDHEKHDTHADKDIEALAAEHEKDKEKHRIADKQVRDTEEKLKTIDAQLQRVRNSHQENSDAEIANNQAENLKRQSELDLAASNIKMKQEMELLKQLRPGTASHHPSGHSNVSSRK
jgi:hypothetical protein